MKAIIVVGMPNENDSGSLGTRFTERAELIAYVLNKKLKFQKQDIIVLTPDGTSGSAGRFLESLNSILLDNPFEDICLFYIGHGWEEGWGLNGTKSIESITYDELGLALVHHSGNLILVNYCCCAGAAVSALANKLGEWLLIAAMPADQSDCARNFCRYVIEDWSSGRFFNPHTAGESTLYIPIVTGNESIQSMLVRVKRKAI